MERPTSFGEAHLFWRGVKALKNCSINPGGKFLLGLLEYLRHTRFLVEVDPALEDTPLLLPNQYPSFLKARKCQRLRALLLQPDFLVSV